MYGDLRVLLASPLNILFENLISEALNRHDLSKSFNQCGMFSYIIAKLSEHHAFDVALIDVSPSNSAVNQVRSGADADGGEEWRGLGQGGLQRLFAVSLQLAAISCDYILPPCSASLYGVCAVWNVTETVVPGECSLPSTMPLLAPATNYVKQAGWIDMD